MVCKHEKVKFNRGMLCNHDLDLYSAKSKYEVLEHTSITTCNICRMTDGNI